MYKFKVEKLYCCFEKKKIYYILLMLKCAIKCETFLLTNKQQDKSPSGNQLDCVQ